MDHEIRKERVVARYQQGFTIEIKPVVSDDYPAVLRQMRVQRDSAAGIKVVFKAEVRRGLEDRGQP